MMKRAEGKHDAHRHFFMRPTHLRRRRPGHRWTCAPLVRRHWDSYSPVGSRSCSLADNSSGAFVLNYLSVLLPDTRGPCSGRLTFQYFESLTTFFFLMIAVQAPETMSTAQFRSKASMVLCKKMKQFPAQQIDFPDSGEPYYSSCSRGCFQWDQSHVYHIL